MSRVLVTGASGFIGRSLCSELLQRGYTVRGMCRSTGVGFVPHGVEVRDIGSIDESPLDWQEALQGCEVIVHLAARAHVMREHVVCPLDAFRAVNVEGALNLARQAVESRVRRFVFISSIGVNGNQTFGASFTENDAPNPREDYAVSKFEAEIALGNFFADKLMEFVVIRPPLVYGPNAPGNFGRLLDLVASGMLLPLGAINNKRSFVALDNLIDLIVTCLDHPAAANQIFLTGDGEDLSTTELLLRMGQALGKPARLLPVPSWLLEGGAALLGKQALAQRLCGSLQVDISKARDLLGWNPPIGVDEGLRRAAADFLAKECR